MNDSGHQFYHQLLDYAEGRLPAAAARALQERLAVDPTAAAELAAVTRLIALMRSDTGEDAPEHVVRRAVRLLPQHRAGHGPRTLRRIAAALLRDSWRAPQLAGLRSDQLPPRDLVYAADECALDIQITERAGCWQLRGQILGPEEDGIVELGGTVPPLAAMINNLGEFTFPPVSAGRYTVSILQRSRVILVDRLDLGPA